MRNTRSQTFAVGLFPRVFYKGIRFEDRSPDQLTLEQMNTYGDFAEGDTFVLKVVDNQILLEKQ